MNKPKHIETWNRNYELFIAFIDENRRLPKNVKDNAFELKMYNWMRNNKNLYKNGKLPQDRVDRLMQISPYILESDNPHKDFLEKTVREKSVNQFVSLGKSMGTVLNIEELETTQITELVKLGIFTAEQLCIVLQAEYYIRHNQVEKLRELNINPEYVEYVMKVLSQRIDGHRSIINTPGIIKSIVHNMDKDTADEKAIEMYFRASGLFESVIDMLFNPEHEVNGMSGRIKTILFSLTERETEVQIYRYWFNMTLRDVGKVYGVTQERIRQVEHKGSRKIRVLARKDYVLYGDKKREERIRSRIIFEGNYKNIDIEQMDLSIRSYNCLKRYGIDNIGDILDKCKSTSDEDLTNFLNKVRNLGQKSINEIISRLREFEALGDNAVISKTDTITVRNTYSTEDVALSIERFNTKIRVLRERAKDLIK